MIPEKTVKLNKKVRLKSMKQIIDICLKNGIGFEFVDKQLSVEFKNDYGYSSDSNVLSASNFGKELLLKKVVLDYDEDGKVLSEDYHTTKYSIPSHFSIFFTNFPKLTKTQKIAPPVPQPPAIVASLLSSDETHPYHDFEFREDGKLDVGCSTLNKKQMLNIFTFLGQCLGHDLEE